MAGFVSKISVLVIVAGAVGQEPKKISPPPGDARWGYEGNEGPRSWGKLSPKWAVCGKGKSQSPIDIGKTWNSNLPPIKAQFRPIELRIIHQEHMADITNTGHTIQVNYTEGDTLEMGGVQYELLQFHFHSPSEHTVHGKHFPIEMHMVHRSKDGKLAVVGVFIEAGKQHPDFDPALGNLPKTKGVVNHLENVKIDVNRLIPDEKTSFRYVGSLTTPPCSEQVQWIILTQPIQFSANQISGFQKVIHGNNRPVQRLHGRTVASDRMAAKDQR